MKHAIIGDLHGRSNWREINIRQFDRLVFLGDYVDSKVLADVAILENLKGVISLKKRHLEKVVLLWGNHDVQYLHFPRQYVYYGDVDHPISGQIDPGVS